MDMACTTMARTRMRPYASATATTKPRALVMQYVSYPLVIAALIQFMFQEAVKRLHALMTMTATTCTLAAVAARTQYASTTAGTKHCVLTKATASPYMWYVLVTATLTWFALKPEQKRPHALGTTTAVTYVTMVTSRPHVSVMAATLPRALATSSSYVPYTPTTVTTSQLALNMVIKRPHALPAMMAPTPSVMKRPRLLE